MIKLYLYFIASFFLICTILSSDGFEGNDPADDQTDELNIIENITSEYKKSVRPSSDVEIYIDINFIQIVSVEEKSQTMTTISYLTLSWLDKRLSWTKANYDDLDEILIPIKNIWTPDISIINQV